MNDRKSILDFRDKFLNSRIDVYLNEKKVGTGVITNIFSYRKICLKIPFTSRVINLPVTIWAYAQETDISFLQKIKSYIICKLIKLNIFKNT